MFQVFTDDPQVLARMIQAGMGIRQVWEVVGTPEQLAAASATRRRRRKKDMPLKEGA